LPVDGKQAMKIYYGIYVFVTSALCPLLVAVLRLYALFTGRLGTHFNERLGLLPHRGLQSLSGSPRIWIHAASLGEVHVAASLIQALRGSVPDCAIMVSTITDHGRDLAIRILRSQAVVVFAPLDFICCVRKALSSAQPQVMVFLETELWPAWICEAQRLGIRTALVNGRISKRSFSRYLKLKPLFQEVLSCLDSLSMTQKQHADRIVAMGADPRHVTIHGNAKYDMLGNLPDPAAEVRMRRLFNLEPTQRVLIAGSTRRGEEATVLDAYERILEQFSDTVLILAPRHIHRTRQLAALLRRRGFRYQLRSELVESKVRRLEPVLILNTFGELFNVYSVGSVVFCGASLVPLGGQNPLEPAAWGKTVLYGPHMDNFVDAKAILEDVDAGFQVGGSQELADKALWFLSHPEEMERIGSRARRAVRANQGAAKCHAKLILALLEGDVKTTRETAVSAL
jgi:3-deoxy-D-manno-octulosonic-acid transferase